MTLKSRWYDLYVSRHYDAALAEATAEARKHAVQGLHLQPGAAVLDLGCGTGLNQPYLAEIIGRKGKIFGLDASTEMLKQARERAEEAGYADQLTLVCGDARRLDSLLATCLNKGGVDGVLVTLFFSVVPDWRDVFTKSYQLLRPDGRYAIMDTYWRSLTLRLRVMCWMYAAKPDVPGFEPLQSLVTDFHMEQYPPDQEFSFYIASGTKAR